MRLRSFTGRTMSEAMARVRRELGPDAIIVSTQEDEDGGTRVTAALDGAEITLPARPAASSDNGTIDALDVALAAHGLAPELVEKILAAALPFEAEEPLVALSSALATLYAFKAVQPGKTRGLVLLAGPPGAGKTVTAAKLAARTVLGGGRVRLISTDTARAGAVDQLAAFARILDVRLDPVTSPHELAATVAADHAAELVVIDTAGVNPYCAEELGELGNLIAASAAEPVLVLPAGGDGFDTMEMVRRFRELGCRRLAVTRLDIARRLGSIIAAADALKLDFAEAGVSSAIADGLNPFNPVLLARLLLSAAARTRRPMLEKTR